MARLLDLFLGCTNPLSNILQIMGNTAAVHSNAVIECLIYSTALAILEIFVAIGFGILWSKTKTNSGIAFLASFLFDRVGRESKQAMDKHLVHRPNNLCLSFLGAIQMLLGWYVQPSHFYR